MPTLNLRGVSPQGFQIIFLTHVRTHDVDNYVKEIQNQPGSLKGSIHCARHHTSTAERGELGFATREALATHFAPEYDVWRRLEATGEWSGARGTRLVDLDGQS